MIYEYDLVINFVFCVYKSVESHHSFCAFSAEFFHILKTLFMFTISKDTVIVLDWVEAICIHVV